MQRHIDIERRIEETMNSLEGMHRAEANPFLYTRIQARLSGQKSVLDRVAAFAGKPAFAFAILVIVLVTNISVMMESPSAPEQLNELSQLAVSDQYSSNVANIYDYENPEP